MMRVVWAAFMVFLLAGVSRADEPKAVVPKPVSALTVKAPVQSCIEGITGDVCHHFFGGAEVTLRMPEEIDYQKVAEHGSSVAAQEAMRRTLCRHGVVHLLQVSSRLEMQIGDYTPIGLGTLKNCDALAKATCPPQEFTVQLPQVEHETEFRIEFKSTSHTFGCIFSATQAPLSVSLKAYPVTLMDPVKSWAEFGDNALVVKDREGRLLDFLDKYKVKYLTRDTMPRDAKKLTIVVGDPAEPEEIEGDVIYLQEKTEILPVVRIRETPKSMTVRVKTKLLDRLVADDPLAQKAFVEIFKEIAK